MGKLLLTISHLCVFKQSIICINKYFFINYILYLGDMYHYNKS